MGQLDDILPEQRDLVIALPYCAAVWVSYAEDEDGEQDDRRESAAIEKALTDYARRTEDFPFVGSVMRQTLKAKDSWPMWADRAHRVPDDCRAVVSFLEGTVSESALKNYKKAIIKIAAAAAGAYGEFGEFENESAGFLQKISAVVGGHKKKTFDHMNVSATESDVLQQLAEALSLAKGK